MASDSSSDYDEVASNKKKALYKMRKYRANLSKEEREKVKAYDRNRKSLKARGMSEEQREERREKDKQRKSLERSQKKEREKKEKNASTWNEKEYNREYKVRIRGARTLEEKEYDNIKAKIRMREFRENRSKEDHNIDKDKAREGMKQGRYYGYLDDEIKRSKTKFKSVGRIWRDFWDSSDAAKELLKKREAEIAAQLEEEDRNESDLAAKLAEEDVEKDAERIRLNADRIKIWRKKIRLELQNALNEPIIMQELEKSDYEKIRDENVKQHEESRNVLSFVKYVN